MLKRYLGLSKNLLGLILILAIAVFLFAVGVQFFQPSTSFNPSIIDNNGIPLLNKFIASAERENWLIPIGTFCSALSALATVYLIWLQQQTIKKHDLEVYTERVISHFFILLDKHRIIINNMKFPFDNRLFTPHKILPPDSPAIGYEAIKSCVHTIKISLSDISYIDLDHYIKESDYFYLKSYEVINKVCNIEKRENLSPIEYFEIVIKNTFDVLDTHTSYFISQYFSNIYIMIKLLNENKYIINANEYMETLRSELTYDEFILIYYYAFIYKKDGEKIFKNLIEDTCFFKGLYKISLDCDPDTIQYESNGTHEDSTNSKNKKACSPFTLYATSAFEEHD